jgi:hypothetical protein
MLRGHQRGAREAFVALPQSAASIGNIARSNVLLRLIKQAEIPLPWTASTSCSWSRRRSSPAPQLALALEPSFRRGDGKKRVNGAMTSNDQRPVG